MRRPFGRNRGFMNETGEQLHLAAAVAAEAVVAEHVRYALELVDEGGDRVPVERLLAAYARLHHLTDEEHRLLTDRVLVAIGRNPDSVARGPLRPPRSVIRRATDRMRGRIHTELREWVDRHTARVELAVLEVHVEHALRFAAILFDQGAPEEAVNLYGETMGLRPTMAEMVRLRVLAEAPVHGEAEAVEVAVEPLHPRPRGPLRLAEDGG